MFVDFTLWTYLLALAVGIFATLYAYLRPDPRTFKKAVALGLFLAALDFIFENMGAAAGLWYSSGSPVFLIQVPIQVFAIAFLSGAAFHLVMKPHKNALYNIATAFLIAVAGTGIEAILLDYKLLTYAGGWTSTHALAAYFATFMLLHFVNLKLHGRRVFRDEMHPAVQTGPKVRTMGKSAFRKRKR